MDSRYLSKLIKLMSLMLSSVFVVKFSGATRKQLIPERWDSVMTTKVSSALSAY